MGSNKSKIISGEFTVFTMGDIGTSSKTSFSTKLSVEKIKALVEKHLFEEFPKGLASKIEYCERSYEELLNSGNAAYMVGFGMQFDDPDLKPFHIIYYSHIDQSYSVNIYAVLQKIYKELK